MAEKLCAANYVEYRVLAVDPLSRTALVIDPPDRDRHHDPRLPSFRIPVRTRTTQRLQQGMNEAWGIYGVVVDYVQTEDSSSPFAIVESLPESRPNTLRPIDLDRPMGLSMSEKTSLDSCFRDESACTLARFGFIHEAASWVEATAGEKIKSRCEIQQLNAGAGFALLRFPMRSGRHYWLKATAKPNFHERAITTLLSKLCPAHVPPVLAANASWNAWITAEKGTTNLAGLSSAGQRFDLLMGAAKALAELQIRTVGQDEDLLAAGALDQRIGVLRRDSDLLFEKIGEAMELQTSTKVPRLDGAGLRALQHVFVALCDFLLSLPVPATVIHGDMNEGNLVWGAGVCQLVDWSEAYVGHPLVTLEHLLLLNNPEDSRLKEVWDKRLIQQYRSVMARVCDPEVLDRASICMPLLAAASAMYGRGTWLSSSIDSMPHRQPWIRTLARYMDRAAHSLQLLRMVA